jgi:hypothetical protein
MRFYELLIGVLFVWRITHLLQAEDGPGELVVALRRRAGPGFWGQLLDCFYCLSVWVAAPVALAQGASTRQRFLLWPALSAGAILLERVTDQRQQPAQALYLEESEQAYVLRETTSSGE